MRLIVRILGTEVLAIDTTPEPEPGTDVQGDCTTYPIGFTGQASAPLDVDMPDRDL